MKFCSFVLAAAPIVSVGLYQENVAVVTRAVMPKDGSALVRVGAHEPFGGSFWHTSKTPLKVRTFAGERNVSVSFRAPAYLRGVIEKAKAEGGHRVRISDEGLYEKGEGWQVFSVSGKIRGGVSDLVELASGSYVNIANGLVVSVDGLAPEDCKFDSEDDDFLFWEFTGADAPFSVEYLTDGARWTPSYRLALAGEKATLFMSGELINNLGDWNETEVSLISGKCNVARDGRPEGFGSRKWKMTNASCEMKCVAVESPSADGYRSAADEGAGDDVHYRSLGKVSLKCRESLSVPLGAEKTDVKRLVEWTTAGLWDAVKFRNPFKFPMAAGKIEIVEDGRVLGMPKCEWTNAGDETFVKIAEANSVKGSFEEQRERKGVSKIGSFGGETMKVGNRTYYKDKVTATFKVTNFRGERAALSVKRLFSGELGEMSLKPTKIKDIPPHDFGVNLDHELTWEFDLEAGETREFRVECARWFAM